MAERRFYSPVVAEHVGLAVSYAAGFSLQFDGINFWRWTIGLQLSSLEKPGLYEHTYKVGLSFTEVPEFSVLILYNIHLKFDPVIA